MLKCNNAKKKKKRKRKIEDKEKELVCQIHSTLGEAQREITTNKLYYDILFNFARKPVTVKEKK